MVAPNEVKHKGLPLQELYYSLTVIVSHTKNVIRLAMSFECRCGQLILRF
jgi:hypothetical protein